MPMCPEFLPSGCLVKIPANLLCCHDGYAFKRSLTIMKYYFG